MNRALYTIIVIVITIAGVLAFEGFWSHLHPPASPQSKHIARRTVEPQDAVDAQQAARDFFTAMKDSDWTTLEKFWPTGPGVAKKFDDVFTDRTKNLIAGLEIVDVGAPYKESGNGWTMIPYVVRFKGGETQTNDLRMMKPPGGHWMWGGGF